MKKVFIDTNILKFSATDLVRLMPREVELDRWGEAIDIAATVHDIVSVNPNNAIKNPVLKKEADLLPDVAELSKKGLLSFVMNFETRMESWNIPNMDSKTGVFYGAEIKDTVAPINYSRTLYDLHDQDRDIQFEFLSGIKDKRFIELQKVTGAYQGKKPLNRNQLLDAWHLWCAEYNSCDYFLTMDFKLINLLHKKNWSSSLKVVMPSELLGTICDGFWRRMWNYSKSAMLFWPSGNTSKKLN